MSTAIEDAEFRQGQAGSALEVWRVFLKLGLTSFGGPVAHLGYFRREFVVRRAWLDERAYADLVALCQFLPGPASSQTGFAIGLMRAGYLGGLAAWAAFTLPSAIAMTLFAYGEGALNGPAGDGLIHGLKLVAVAIVAQAVLGMAQSLTPDRPRAAIAVLSLILMALAPAAWAQIAVILLGALAGLILCRTGGEVSLAAVEPRSPPLSTARVRWCSAAVMWCCRCCGPPWSIRAGSRQTPFWPATARPRPCRGRCSPSLPISARSPALGRAASPGRRWRWLRSSRPDFCC